MNYVIELSVFFESLGFLIRFVLFRFLERENYISDEINE